MSGFSTWNQSMLYSLTDEDTAQLHAALLEIYKDIRRVCEKYSLRLIAAGGTALGAVRHRGFIPWDDDMDLFMLREEYEQFRKVFHQELGDRYYLLAVGSPDGVNCFLPRVMKKNTTFLNMIDETAPYPHGIYIDINLLEYAPENRAAFLWKAFRADALRLISYSVYWHQYRSKSLRAFMLPSKGALYYRIRMALGWMFSFRTAEAWFAAFDRLVRGKPSGVYVVPSGSKRYAGEKFSPDIIFPLRTMPFEDTTMDVFQDYHWYLKNLYGDYMRIPKPEERGRHLCLKLAFTGDAEAGH